MRKLKKEDTRTHAHTLAKEKNKSFAGTLSFGSHKCYIFLLFNSSLNNLDYMALYRQSTNGWIR
jgi:hypothetical protein